MKNSKLPILAGAALVVAGFAVYGLDSWRGSHREGLIDHALRNARQITTIDVPPLENGELVIATDVPMPGARLTDPDLGFSVDGLSFSRDVQIYQWREVEETVNNQKTYSYSKRWVDAPISSSFFHDPRHENFGSLPFSDKTFRPQSYVFGDLKLDRSFASSFPASRKLEVTRELYDQMPSYFRQRFSLVDGELFPNREARIGDIRVTFSFVPSQQSTIVGAYSNGSIVPAKTDAGTIAILREGNLSLEELAAAEKSSSASIGIFLKIVAGMLALGGLILGVIGIRMSSASSVSRVGA
ncbi:hypothetical protein G6L37_05820 [Agrobacterium rubi]|nr:hypothetical protein [Agrobacterium rubi]NTF24877.1 hypothetical protein [Agrobacterium rubi]